METKKIIAFSVIVLGLLGLISGFISTMGDISSNGLLFIQIGFFFALSGVILLFSVVGSIIILVGLLSLAIPAGWFSIIAYIFLVAIGILYGIIEGIILLVKRKKKF